jgi:hypothetical protein
MTDFEAYIRCFKEGLTVEQVEMIRELFSDQPATAAVLGGREAAAA